MKKHTNHSEFINTVIIKRFYNFILPFSVRNTFNEFKTPALQQPMKSFVHSGQKKKRLFSLILQFKRKIILTITFKIMYVSFGINICTHYTFKTKD